MTRMEREPLGKQRLLVTCVCVKGLNEGNPKTLAARAEVDATERYIVKEKKCFSGVERSQSG